MTDIKTTTKDLEEIKDELIPAISRMYRSGFSSVFACEKVEEKINNALELLKSQQAEIKRLKSENELIRQNNKELDKQRIAFANKIEKLKWGSKQLEQKIEDFRKGLYFD